jgi:hypothetical protein
MVRTSVGLHNRLAPSHIQGPFGPCVTCCNQRLASGYNGGEDAPGLPSSDRLYRNPAVAVDERPGMETLPPLAPPGTDKEKEALRNPN